MNFDEFANKLSQTTKRKFQELVLDFSFFQGLTKRDETLYFD